MCGDCVHIGAWKPALLGANIFKIACMQGGKGADLEAARASTRLAKGLVCQQDAALRSGDTHSQLRLSQVRSLNLCRVYRCMAPVACWLAQVAVGTFSMLLGTRLLTRHVRAQENRSGKGCRWRKTLSKQSSSSARRAECALYGSSSSI